MQLSHVLRAGSVIALAGLIACAEQPTTSPTDVGARKVDGVESAKQPSGSGEVAKVSPLLQRINARLAAKGSNLRIDRGELMYAAKAYDAASPTLIVANNRTHTLPYQWVPGDPRRGGHEGVTYAIDPDLRTTAFGIPNLPAIEVDGGGFRTSTQAELEGYIEEALQSWRDRRCSDSPIDRLAVPAGTDPDLLDQVLLGNPVNANYAQPADIVQAGWQPPAFFEAITPGGADGILGVSFTFWFVDDQNTPDPSDDVETDIDGDGKRDTGLVEIYYNPSFIWTNRGTPGGFIDFYSVIAHESGHGLGLAHFGKVFITKKDASDGIQISDIKYAPKALMNAVYVEGRDEIRGSDNGSFCQIWAHQ
jgi:hypothetical protein